MTGRHQARRLSHRHGTRRQGTRRQGTRRQRARPPGLGRRAARAWRLLTGSAAVTAVAFGLLTGACALIAVAGPRTSAQLRTNAFLQGVAATPAADRAVVGTLDADSLGTAMSHAIGRPQLEQAEAALRTNLARTMPLGPARGEWASLQTPFTGFADHARQAGGDSTEAELVYRATLSQNVRVVAGKLPADGGAPVAARAGKTTTVPVSVTEATARRFGFAVGARIPLPGPKLTLQVAAIVAPAAPGAPFWSLDPIAAAPVLVQPQQGSPYWQGSVFVPATALPAVDQAFAAPYVQLTWVLPLSLGRLSATGAVHLAGTLPAALSADGQLVFSGFDNAADITLTTGASSLLGEFAAEDGAVGNVLDLMSVSLAIVGAVLVLLAAWLMAEKRREEFAVLRARGASRRQLALAALAGSAVAALPGAAAGIALAVLLTSGSGGALAWWLAALTIAAALAGPVLIAVRSHRGYAGEARPDRPPGRMASVRRLIAESALVLGSVGGLIVLHDQGTGPGGGDLYASAAPVLIAVPVSIILLRLYPLLLRPLLAVAGRRSGVTAFLGLARAARVSATAVLPAFAMVLALSLVSFTGMVRGAVTRGEVAASWQQAGADAVITTPGVLTEAQQRSVARVPGVQRTAAVALESATRGVSLGGITAVVASPRQYAGLLAATPLRPAPRSFAGWRGTGGGTAGNPVPVLASARLAAILGRAPAPLVLQNYQHVVVRVVGIAPAMSQVQPIGGASVNGFLVLPRAALGRQAPAASALLAVGSGFGDSGFDEGALTAAAARWHATGTVVTLRSQLLAALEQAPLERGAYLELALGGIAAAAGALLALLLVLLLSAQSRQLTLARAATMGMSTVQARLLVLIEALPQILAVIVGGLICALALAPLVGPALGLSVFTGSATPVPVRIEPAWLTGAALALLILAVATLSGQAVLAGRGTARSLRIGG